MPNRRLAQWRVTWLNEHSTSHQLLWLNESFVLRNPPLRQAPKRWQTYKKPKTRMNKIPGIKILIALPILFLGFLFLLGRPWDNPTMKEIYLEQFQCQKVGIVEKTELWKGCGLSIQFENSDRKYISFKKDTSSFSIQGDCDINEQIHRKDFFQKLPNSNKCFIIRNDSIMLFDCVTNLDFIIEKFNIPRANITG